MVEGYKTSYEVNAGEALGAIPDPTWPDASQEFVGWVDDDRGNPVDPETFIPDGDTTIIATWQPPM